MKSGLPYVAAVLREDIDPVVGGLMDECESDSPDLDQIERGLDEMRSALERAVGEFEAWRNAKA